MRSNFTRPGTFQNLNYYLINIVGAYLDLSSQGLDYLKCKLHYVRNSRFCHAQLIMISIHMCSNFTRPGTFQNLTYRFINIVEAYLDLSSQGLDYLKYKLHYVRNSRFCHAQLIVISMYMRSNFTKPGTFQNLTYRFINIVEAYLDLSSQGLDYLKCKLHYVRNSRFCHAQLIITSVHMRSNFTKPGTFQNLNYYLINIVEAYLDLSSQGLDYLKYKLHYVRNSRFCHAQLIITSVHMRSNFTKPGTFQNLNYYLINIVEAYLDLSSQGLDYLKCKLHYVRNSRFCHAQLIITSVHMRSNFTKPGTFQNLNYYVINIVEAYLDLSSQGLDYLKYKLHYVRNSRFCHAQLIIISMYMRSNFTKPGTFQNLTYRFINIVEAYLDLSSQGLDYLKCKLHYVRNSRFCHAQLIITSMHMCSNFTRPGTFQNLNYYLINIVEAYLDLSSQGLDYLKYKLHYVRNSRFCHAQLIIISMYQCTCAATLPDLALFKILLIVL